MNTVRTQNPNSTEDSRRDHVLTVPPVNLQQPRDSGPRETQKPQEAARGRGQGPSRGDQRTKAGPSLAPGPRNKGAAREGARAADPGVCLCYSGSGQTRRW